MTPGSTGSTAELRAELARLVCEIKACDPQRLGDAAEYAALLGYDSLDFVELAVRLDSGYGVSVGEQPDDMAALASLDTLTGLVHNRRRR